MGVIPTSQSGTIAAGGTAQVLMAENKARSGWLIQNQSSGDLWVNELGAAAATQPSFRIPAGGTMRSEPDCVPVGEISIFGAATGQAFAAREW